MSALTKTFATTALILAAIIGTTTAANAEDTPIDPGACTLIVQEDGTEATLCEDPMAYATSEEQPTDPATPVDGTPVVTSEGPDCSEDMDACMRSSGMPVAAAPGTSAEVEADATVADLSILIAALAGATAGIAGTVLYKRRKPETQNETPADK